MPAAGSHTGPGVGGASTTVGDAVAVAAGPASAVAGATGTTTPGRTGTTTPATAAAATTTDLFTFYNQVFMPHCLATFQHVRGGVIIGGDAATGMMAAPGGGGGLADLGAGPV